MYLINSPGFPSTTLIKASRIALLFSELLPGKRKDAPPKNEYQI